MSHNFSTAPFLLGAALAVLAGCSATDGHPYFHKSAQAHPAEWGYEGDTGPDHWGELDPAYSLASAGRQQSPIDLRDAQAKDLAPIEFHYHPSAINLVYNGHTVEEKEDGKSSIVVDGKEYVLQQFHFHSPSEHTIDGRHSAMEMHLVHKSADGEVAVVGVMIEEGAENAAFAPVWDQMPDADQPERQDESTVDANALLPADRGYFRYMGSFTTPPCTEDVLWMVMTQPVHLSPAQIGAFRDVIHGNNRPVQPLNGRTIAVTR